MTRQARHDERYRPQFHFTARENWINDPNGCVFHNGEYHLFFQRNPMGLVWGNMTWGHAISPDLVRWRQLPDALLPYGDGMIYSGSAVVDGPNTSGFGSATDGPLVAAFTHAREPYGQAIAYSNDNGRTWGLFAGGSHVVPNQRLDPGERDPKVFWHAPSHKWIMVLWVHLGRARFFAADDLRHWRYVSDFEGEGFYECPDLFELPIDEDPANTRWVLHDAAFRYWIGTFDGVMFIPETGPFQGDHGNNFYAAQTWNNTGKRVIQIAWMRGGQYPGMPFNQQMSFPCDLALRSTANGLRLCRTPAPEIKGLYLDGAENFAGTLEAGRALCLEQAGDLFDLQLEVALAPDSACVIHLRDVAITCAETQIGFLGRTAPIASVKGVLSVRLLVDRASIELFGNGGEVSMTSCFLPAECETRIRVEAVRGPIHIRSLVAHRLASARQSPP